MSFFADPGAWFEQAAQDVGEALQEGPTNIANEIATGDVVTGILKAQDDFAQVVYDVFNPDNPNPNSVIDQIETNVDQQPTSDDIVDQIESTIVQPPTSDYIVDQIESTNDQQSTPDYSTNKVATNDVNYSRGSDVLMNFNSTEADLGIDSFTTRSGLKITDLVDGTGVQARPGQTMEVHYRGMLEDGTQFDASYNRNSTFTFPLGAGQVISGFEEGIQGMKVGGKRTLEIPPGLGYGARGTGGVIPPNATLIFEVELIAVDGNRNVSSLVTTDAMLETYDPITNPNPGLEGSGPEFGEVGIDALSIDSTNEADFTTIEDLQGLIAGGGYDSIDSMNESLMDSMNSIFEVAEIPMF